jgi:hypothetical protein
VALDEPVERRVARTPRLVDPATDLHSRTRAGGERRQRKGRRPMAVRPPDDRRSVAAALAEQGPGAGNPRAKMCGCRRHYRTHCNPRATPKSLSDRLPSGLRPKSFPLEWEDWCAPGVISKARPQDSIAPAWPGSDWRVISVSSVADRVRKSRQNRQVCSAPSERYRRVVE